MIKAVKWICLLCVLISLRCSTEYEKEEELHFMLKGATILPDSICGQYKKVYLGNNRLKSFDCIIWEGIEELDLSFNQVENLPKVLMSCQKLHTINLRENALKEFPDILKELEGLRKLIISGNNLEVTQDDVDGLQGVTFLDVSANTIELTVKGLLLSMPNLETLKLNAVKGTQNEQTFLAQIKHEHLLYLELNDNGILFFPDLSKCNALREINLINNDIENIPAKRLNENAYISVLNLSFNKIESVNLPVGLKIKKLNLAQNNLNDSSTIQLPGSCEIIDLSSNHFTDLPEDLIERSYIKRLNFSNNQILNFDSFVERLKQLKYLEKLKISKQMLNERQKQMLINELKEVNIFVE